MGRVTMWMCIREFKDLQNGETAFGYPNHFKSEDDIIEVSIPINAVEINETGTEFRVLPKEQWWRGKQQ